MNSRRAKRLEPRVCKAAQYLSRSTGIDSDEAEQEIWLGILETAKKRSLLSQTDAYVVQAGVYWTRNEWRKRMSRENREVVVETAVTDDFTDLLQSQSYILRLMRGLAGDRVAKALVAGLIRGERKNEVARRAGVSPQAISGARKRVRAAMEAIG